MTDDRRILAIDSVLRRLDVPAEPDEAFVRSSASLLRQRAAAVRTRDRNAVRRLWHDVRSGLAQLGARTEAQRAALVGLVALALLVLFAALIALLGATRDRPLGNGSLVLIVAGELRAIDLDTGVARAIAVPGDTPARVSRSPDGRQIAYWRSDPTGDQIIVINVDGTGRRRVAADLPITTTDRPAAWSPDSRRLAVEVEAGDVSRILVVNVETGNGWFVTPAEVGAHKPLWSPDGGKVAFAQEAADGSSVLAVARADGTGDSQVVVRDPAHPVDGANSWSPDGLWIYFGATRSIWRVNVVTGQKTDLDERYTLPAAPALSPDGTRLSYIESTPSNWDLFVAEPDGAHRKLLLQNARNSSWSADSQWLLSRWLPPDQPGGLVLISATSGERRLVVPADQACPDRNQGCDLDWGQPKP